MLQQQQMNQQMQHQQNISQYLQGSQYPNAPWWTDGAMEYWPPGPPVPPAGAMSKARDPPPLEPEAAAPAATTPAAPAAEGAAPGEGAPAPGGKADTTPAAPAAEPETTAAAPETTPAAPAAEPETTPAAPETTPAAPAAEPAAPTVEGAGAALEDDSWLRRCNLCGERSYWRANACLNPHCTVTRQIFVKCYNYKEVQDLLQSFFSNGVIVDQGGARSPAILFF